MLPFFYAVAGEVDGSALQDAVEAAYFAFRTHPRDISQATSRACNACAPDAGSQVNRGFVFTDGFRRIGATLVGGVGAALARWLALPAGSTPA
jgi:hypothetical protein